MLPSAVGGHERLNGNAKVFENLRPLSIGAGLWPGCAADSKNHSIRLCVGTIGKIHPNWRASSHGYKSVPHRKVNAQRPEPRHPSSEQRGGFEIFQINPAASRLESLRPEASCPFTEIKGREACQNLAPAFLVLSGCRVAGRKDIQGFGVGEVHAAFSGHKKLPSDGGLRVEECDFGPSLCRDFCCAQTCWAAANDCDAIHWEDAGVRVFPAKLKTVISSASCAQSRNVVVMSVCAP